jgi:beta-lactamase regulating signal transducer with metallopeptidase domain
MIRFGTMPDLLIDRVGFTLVSSLWQGLIVSLVLFLLLYIIPKHRVELKYWLAVTALASMVFWTGYTFTQQLFPVKVIETASSQEIYGLSLSGSQLNLEDIKPVSVVKGQLDHWLFKLQPYMDKMVVIWLLGVFFFLIRLQGSMIYLRKLRVWGTHPLPSSWQQKVMELSDKLGIQRKIGIVESSMAQVPMVIGHLKPVILLPVGMLTGLSAREVEAILVHELAHIKRFDYLINIVQTLIESLLFFNPAIWWISHTIREHREHCCDDIAVKYCGNQLEYANALSNLGAWSLKTPALGMGLFKNKNELLMRIKRIVYPQVGGRTLKEKLIPGVVLVLTVLFLSWYSHKLQAHMMPVDRPEVLGELHSEQQVKDTLPQQETEEILPPMEPEQVVDEPWPNENEDNQIELEIDVDIPDFEVDVPNMLEFDTFVIPSFPDVEELVDLSLAVVPDIKVLVDPYMDIDIEELVDMERLKEAMVDLHIQLDDTTRERIREALQAQRLALERAKEEQAEALENARKQLRLSLEAERPDDLTEEEWEMAKDQIAQAERQVERALRQSERALEQALKDQDYDFHRHIDRVIRDNADREVIVRRHVERVESDQERYRRNADRAHEHANRYRHREVKRHSGKEAKLRSNLLQDGLIDNYNANVTLSFTRNQIKINGVKLQGSVKEKYRELLDDMYGKNSTGALEFRD